MKAFASLILNAIGFVLFVAIPLALLIITYGEMKL